MWAAALALACAMGGIMFAIILLVGVKGLTAALVFAIFTIMEGP